MRFDNVKWDRSMTSAFGGLNRHERIGDGEWADMENLTVEEYPVAKVRRERVFLSPSIAGPSRPSENNKFAVFPAKPIDAISVEGELYILCELSHIESYIESMPTVIYNKDNEYRIGNNAKHIVDFGRGVFADNGTFLQYNEENGTREPIKTKNEVSISSSPGATISLADGEFSPISFTDGATAPSNPQNGDYWYDTSVKGLYKYSSASGEWVAFPTAYIKIKTSRSLAGFRKGDAVEIHSEPAYGPEGNYIISDIKEPIENVTTDWTMWLEGVCAPQNVGYMVSIRRRCPVFDYICTWKNRVWGCRYGENDKGEFVNEIYGSALGDALNWFKFEGTAADSYMASVGTGGRFTGIGSTEEAVFFFKEDRVYVLTGSEPSNFRLQEMWGPGLSYGNAKSIVPVNGALYYKAEDGFARIGAYSYPTMISDKLCRGETGVAIGGRENEQVFWMVTEADGEPAHILIYDLNKAMWTKENSVGDLPFALIRHRNKLLYLSTGVSEVEYGFRYVLDEEKKNAADQKAEEYGFTGSTALGYKYACNGVSQVFVAYTEDGIKTIGQEQIWINRWNNIMLLAGREIYNFYLEYFPSTYPVQSGDEANMARAEMFLANDSWVRKEIIYTYECNAAYLCGPIRDDMDEGFMTKPFAEEPETGDYIEWACEEEAAFSWYGVTGLMGLTVGKTAYPYEKRVRQIMVRLKAEAGTLVRVSIMLDESGQWLKVCDERRQKTGSFTIRYAPAARCDMYRLLFEGEGDCVIYSIEEETEYGGE